MSDACAGLRSHALKRVGLRTHAPFETHTHTPAIPNLYERRQTYKSRISGLLSADVCCSTLWLFGEIKTGSGN